jgi:hypothetical protein
MGSPGLPASRVGMLQRVHDFYYSKVQPHGVTPKSFADVFAKSLMRTTTYFRDTLVELLSANLHTDNMSEHTKSLVAHFYAELERNLTKRTLYVTSNGLVGYTYHPDPVDGIRAGDVVVGLFGVNFPFILRPNENASYSMVNVTNVLGHIFGHEFLRNREDDVENGILDYKWEDGPRARAHAPSASWRDYETFGMREYAIV